MNILDKTIGYFAPRTAVKRAAARAQLDAIDEVRGYDGAKRDRHNSGWVATGSSQNAEAQTALGTLRNNSRDLGRNEPIAANIFRKLPAYIVGTGIKPFLEAAEEGGQVEDDLKRVAENWQTFVDHSDPECLLSFYGQQKLGVRSVVESGDVLIRWHDRPASGQFKSLVQCQLLEGDFLDGLKNEELANGNLVIQGVEFDRNGCRVAYWLFDTHPGENTITRMSSLLSRRVPAEFITHIFDPVRPGQVRGIPWIHAGIERTRHVADYDHSERMRKRTNACFGMFIERDAADETAAPTSKETTGTKRTREHISPGMIMYGEQGQKAHAITPAVDQGYSDFTTVQNRAISSGAGTPPEIATGDSTNINYSSRRGSTMDFHVSIDDWQSNMVIPMMCLPAWNRVHASHARMGTGPAEWPRAHWQVPPRPWVDPRNEAQANEIDRRGGAVTFAADCRRRGLDPEAVLAEHEKYAERLKALGFNTTGSAPAAPVNPDAKDTDDDEQSEEEKSEAA